MAIWQYKLFAVPSEEFRSYFNETDIISIEAFDHIEWWRYLTYKSINFNSLRDLPLSESWSKDIILLGDVNSNCVEILIDGEKLIEVSLRIDLRTKYKVMIESVCAFAEDNGLLFLNENLKRIFPFPEIISRDIDNHGAFKGFIDRNLGKL